MSNDDGDGDGKEKSKKRNRFIPVIITNLGSAFDGEGWGEYTLY